MTPEQDFLEYIIRSLVEFPDAVSTSHRQDDMGILIRLSVDPSDMGKIIGRDGNMANAIRTIMKAYGYKHRANISIKVTEPGIKDTFDHA